MKQSIKTIAMAATAIIAMMTACSDASEAPNPSDKTPITVGNLVVAGEAPNTRADAEGWTPEYESFNDGDKLTVTNTTKSITTTYQFQAPATWIPALETGDVLFYAEGTEANVADTDDFTAAKGSLDLVET